VIERVVVVGKQSIRQPNHTSAIGGDVPYHRPAGPVTRVVGSNDDLSNWVRQLTAAGALGVYWNRHDVVCGQHR